MHTACKSENLVKICSLCNWVSSGVRAWKRPVHSCRSASWWSFSWKCAFVLARTFFSMCHKHKRWREPGATRARAAANDESASETTTSGSASLTYSCPHIFKFSFSAWKGEANREAGVQACAAKSAVMASETDWSCKCSLTRALTLIVWQRHRVDLRKKSRFTLPTALHSSAR